MTDPPLETQPMVPSQQRGWRRVYNGFFFSMDGLRACYFGEEAFRQEIWLATVLIPIALLLPISGLSTAFLISSLLLVLIVEILNSAVEAVVDRISKEHHILSKKAKDMGSAAVLLSLFNVVVVWVGVLWSEWG